MADDEHTSLEEPAGPLAQLVDAKKSDLSPKGVLERREWPKP